MSERRHPNVVNLSEIEPGELFPPQAGAPEKFGGRARRLTTAVGSRGIGCSWYEIQPGKTSFPFHWHASNEEAIYILAGEGTLRLGDQRVEVRAGDYIAFPTGPEGAHQLIAGGSAPLQYLCFSTMHTVEVVGYPDSKKMGAMATAAPGQPAYFRQLHEEANQKGYFDGEG
jgi:uncharacterized cupin superfamily protein